jgi:hypothetical protein
MAVPEDSWRSVLTGITSARRSDFYDGYVYIAFASHGDEGDYHGWLFAYNGTSMAQSDVFCLTPNGVGAGIWGAGAGHSDR